jgi:hypothetical protein
MKLETTLGRIEAAKSLIRETARYTRKWGRSFQDHNTTLREGLTPTKEGLPRWAIEFVDGYALAFVDTIWANEVVYSYVMDGVRLAIDSPEYKQIPHHDEKGCLIPRLGGAYIWRTHLTPRKWA